MYLFFVDVVMTYIHLARRFRVNIVSVVAYILSPPLINLFQRTMGFMGTFRPQKFWLSETSRSTTAHLGIRQERAAPR
jgi:hypothetical protein